MAVTGELHDMVDEKISSHKIDCLKDLDNKFVSNKQLSTSFWHGFGIILGVVVTISGTALGFVINTKLALQETSSVVKVIKTEQEETKHKQQKIEAQLNLLPSVNSKLDELIKMQKKVR